MYFISLQQKFTHLGTYLSSTYINTGMYCIKLHQGDGPNSLNNTLEIRKIVGSYFPSLSSKTMANHIGVNNLDESVYTPWLCRQELARCIYPVLSIPTPNPFIPRKYINGFLPRCSLFHHEFHSLPTEFGMEQKSLSRELVVLYVEANSHAFSLDLYEPRRQKESNSIAGCKGIEIYTQREFIPYISIQCLLNTSWKHKVPHNFSTLHGWLIEENNIKAASSLYNFKTLQGEICSDTELRQQVCTIIISVQTQTREINIQ